MENRLKLRLSRTFRSSFGSCKTQNLSDVIDNRNSICTSSNNRYFSSTDEPFMSSNPTTGTPEYPSISRPRCHETFGRIVPGNCSLSKESFPRHKISERNSLSVPDDVVGRRCRPASQASPLNQLLKLQAEEREQGIEKKKKSRKPKKMHPKNRKGEAFPCPFIPSSNDDDWFSSDDEREDATEIPFSSKSVSLSSYRTLSGSSDCDPNRPPTQMRNPLKKTEARRRRAGKENSSEHGLLPLQGKMKGIFAVVKSSSDPYSDFRTSMVEMIIEMQIFGAQEMKQLVQCFLSLNSAYHHRVIIDVFAEIWDTLFSCY
ncbi:hypothetical protein Nepgr_018404 [Nepenthes gracilis]|uniref:Transcription repressor n=1 Tax=Nepenthes gracilis TaxID=150966 RepID=A0AAD3SRA7_NEPGR|nr:hypothetical protein Nepgr_018404 [Nepenthes gracilis]